MSKIFFAIVSIASAALAAHSAQSLPERLDAIAGADVAGNRSVGITAAVVKGKETLLLKAYGKSDVEGDVAMTADTIIPIGSTTKQFTAAAILQLRDEGKLTLEDEITKWLAGFDTRGNRVTLRHLLAHTSGITELSQIQELRAMRLIRNPSVTRETVYQAVSRQPFLFPTGSLQMYSNTNFWLLGLIVEKASGMTYEDYIEKRIFGPLGMSRSMYCNDAENVPRRAHGYGMRNGTSGRVPPIVHTATYAAGAICSTAEDMIKWLQALHGGKVLSSKSYADMITPAKLQDGTALRYSMGLLVGDDRNGSKYIGHDGGGFGFSSDARWYPDAQLAVVILTNSEPDNISLTADALAAAVLPPPTPAGPFNGDTSVFAGSYKGPGRGGEMGIEVIRTPQGITASINGAAAAHLAWIRGWTFRQGALVFTFRRQGNDGPATELRFDTAGGHFILKRQ